MYDLFVTVEGMTPQEYKSRGLGLQITYGYHASPFGMCFIAVTERGICGLRFIDESRQRDKFARFRQPRPAAELIHNPQVAQPYMQRIFQPVAAQPERLQVLVQGTAFQVKVWEALVNIPYGSVSSYQQVAEAIGQPTAARAVGMAVARNPLLYPIPCHRIICQDGTVGDFHWGQRSGSHRHSYETIMYITQGQGYTIIEDQRVDWPAGDAVYVPVWAWHHNVNLSDDTLARYVSCDNAPQLHHVGVAMFEPAQ